MGAQAEINTGTVNTNTDTSQGGEPIVKGGQEYTTFDDLESVMTFDKDGGAKKKDSPSEKRPPIKSEEAEPEADGEDESEQGAKKESKDAAPKKKEGDAEADGEEEGKPEDKKASGQKDDKFAPKTKFKVDIDGKPVEIPGTTSFKVKDQDVPLQELINNYHGQVNWNKKHMELAGRTKEFESSVKQVNENISQAYKLAVEQKNPKALVTFVAEIMGADPIEIWKGMKRQILEAQGIKPGEGDVPDDSDKEDELEFYRERDQRAKQKKEQEDNHQVLESRFTAVEKKYSMSSEDIVTAYDQMIASKKFNPQEITPESIGEYWAQQSASKIAEDIVKEYDGDLENSEKAVELLKEAKLKFPDFTKEDLEQVLSDALGVKSKTSKNLSRKIQKGEPSKAKPPAARSGKDGPMFWDEL